MIDFNLRDILSNPLVQAAILGSIFVPIGMSFKTKAASVISWFWEKFTITISVNRDDNHASFYGVSKLLLNNQIWRTSTRVNESRMGNDPEYASEGTGFAFYKGKFIVFHVILEKRGMFEMPCMKITCWGRPSTGNVYLEKLVREGYELRKRPPEGKIRITKYGSSYSEDTPNYSDDTDYIEGRALSTVALPEDTEIQLRDSFRRFFDHKDLYSRLGITYKMNILLYGPPGTGKSSLVKALASEYGLDLRIASSGITSKVIEGLPSSSKPYIFLIEDIDVHKFSVDRSGADSGKVSMSTLLNLLDGVSTPEGMIAILTTNSLESLDPAIYRPGRIDLTVHVDNLDRDTVKTWAKRNNLDVDLDAFQYPVSGAEVSAETFRRNLCLN